MLPKTTHDRLQYLYDLILEERECAKNMDMIGMTQAAQKKEVVIDVLANETELAEESKPLAKKVRDENRRNAYLFKATLGWIRETMVLLGNKSVVTTYSSAATTIPSTVNGRLLSGRI